MSAMLQHVIEHGGPAQAARAGELQRQLQVDPASAELKRAAAALVDTFLHDPYLSR